MVYKSRSVKKSKRLRITRKRGGVRIGEGRTSTVFRPPLKCEENITTYDTDKYVSKLTTREVALKEYEEGEQLRDIPDFEKFTVVPQYICKVSKDQTNSNLKNKYYNHYGKRGERDYLVIMPYGGETLTKKYVILETMSYNPEKVKNEDRISLEYINRVIVGLKNLAGFVKRMYDMGIAHNDIQFDNILIDDRVEPFQLRLIDFEKCTKNDSKCVYKNYDLWDIMNCIRDIYDFRNMIYRIESPELSLMKPMSVKRKEYTPEHFARDMEIIDV